MWFVFQLGAAGLVLIALLTDHCCNLIVKCKYAAIDKVMTLYRSEVQRDEGSVDEDEMKVVHNRLLKNLTYGDIGKLSFGNPGLVLVNLCLLFTQFGFCVSYFIFIGNTFYTLFPSHNVTQTNSSIYNTSGQPPFLNPLDAVEETDSLTGEAYEDSNAEYLYSSYVLGNSSASNLTQDWSFISVSSAPRLEYLILVPLPFFIMFAIIRKVRHLGVISILADVSIFVGCACVFIYLLIRKYTVSYFSIALPSMSNAFSKSAAHYSASEDLKRKCPCKHLEVGC